MRHSIFAALLIVILSSCALPPESTSVQTTVKLSNSLLVVSTEYDNVRTLLLETARSSRSEDQIVILNLVTETDILVEEVKTIWKADKALALTNIDTFFNMGEDLYDKWFTFLAPRIDEFSPIEQMYLVEFNKALLNLQDLREEFNANEDATDRYMMLQTGVEFATLALKLGMVLL